MKSRPTYKRRESKPSFKCSPCLKKRHSECSSINCTCKICAERETVKYDSRFK